MIIIIIHIYILWWYPNNYIKINTIYILYDDIPIYPIVFDDKTTSRSNGWFWQPSTTPSSNVFVFPWWSIAQSSPLQMPTTTRRPMEGSRSMVDIGAMRAVWLWIKTSQQSIGSQGNLYSVHNCIKWYKISQNTSYNM